MRILPRSKSIARFFAVASAAVLLMAGAAMANTVTLTQGTITATLNVGAGAATLSLSDSATEYTNSVAIQLGGNSFTSTGGTASSGTWTFKNGQNAIHCSSATGNWLCAFSTSNVLINGLSFTFNFTGTPPTNGTDVSVQFDVCNSTSPSCTQGGGNQKNFVTNFSQDGRLQPGGPVPEPASMLLLGTGLLGVGAFVSRRYKK